MFVSIYLPINRATVELQQNSTRLKTLIQEAASSITESGLDNKETSDFLQPIQELVDSDENFWVEGNNDGLAVFLTSGVFHYYRLPSSFPELVVVTDKFHFKPLLPLLNSDEQYYVLALSQQAVKLLSCTRNKVREIELKDVPKSLDEALGYDETAKEGQRRISTPKGATNNSVQQAGSFHGQGSPDRDKHQQDILQFFHAVDDGLHKYLQRKRAPLVLAGVEYLFPIYREANNYPHLVEEGITGNPENVKPEELQSQAWEIVEPLFLQNQQEAIERYKELSATGRTSTDIKEIVSAAHYSRIEQLFVAVGVEQWGIFNPDSNIVDLHSEAELGDEDLLDTAATQTVLNGGTVYTVEPEEVPDQARLAAIFRY